MSKEAAEAKDTQGQTPLSIAAEHGHLDVVKLLVKEGGADVESEDKCLRKTPLSWAAAPGHLEVVEFLVEEGGADVETNGGFTPLIVAAMYGHLEMAKFLVQRGGADIESKDLYVGRTPLIWAAESGELEVAKFLVEEGGADESKDDEGNTALDVARQQAAKGLPWSEGCRAVAVWLEKDSRIPNRGSRANVNDGR